MKATDGGIRMSVAAAAVSYLVVETPFLRLRRSWVGSSAAPTGSGAPGGDEPNPSVEGDPASPSPANATVAAAAGDAGAVAPAGDGAVVGAVRGAVEAATAAGPRPGRGWLRR